MAHIAKYKAPSVGHMLAHYRRDASSLERENIDPERTKDNYTFDLDACNGKVRAAKKGIEPNWETVAGRIEKVNEAAKAAGKRVTRKDAVVMADVVVTLPENVHKGDEGKFFGYTYWFLIDKLGKENMMGGFVHRDEIRKDGAPVRDHMHVPFTPILDGRFNYKQMVPRSFYKTMHKELGDYLERCMGYRPEIELGEETRAQRVYTDKSVDIDKVRGAVDKAIVEPAQDEAARIVEQAEKKATELLRAAQEQITDAQGNLAELDSRLEDVKFDITIEEKRLERLRQRANGVARDVDELQPIVAEVRGWEAAGKAERGAILDKIVVRCDGLANQIRAGVEGIRLKVKELRSRISRSLECGEQPKRQSLDDKLRNAQRAADAWNRKHAAPPTTSRLRGQSR